MESLPLSNRKRNLHQVKTSDMIVQGQDEAWGTAGTRPEGEGDTDKQYDGRRPSPAKIKMTLIGPSVSAGNTLARSLDDQVAGHHENASTTLLTLIGKFLPASVLNYLGAIPAQVTRQRPCCTP